MLLMDGEQHSLTHKELIVWGNREIGNNLRKIRHSGGGAGRTRVQSAELVQEGQ